MNILISTISPLAKILSAVLGCAEAHLIEQPDALIELSVQGEPQPGSVALMVLDIHAEFVGPQEWAQCVLDSI